MEYLYIVLFYDFIITVLLNYNLNKKMNDTLFKLFDFTYNNNFISINIIFYKKLTLTTYKTFLLVFLILSGDTFS